MRTPTRGIFTRPGLHEHDPAIFALAIPAFGALAADPLYSLVDTAFVGHLGTVELGAVAVGTAAFTASFWLFSFLAYGVTPKVARAVGAEDPRSAAEVGIQALFLAGALGVAVAILGTLLSEPIVDLLGAKGRVATQAESYLRIRILAAPFVLVVTVCHGWMRGAQDTRTPMFVVAAGAILNAILDYVLIYPVGWGVQGAAWATVIGQGLTAVVLLWVVLRRMVPVPWRFDPRVMRSLLVIGGDLIVRAGALVAALTIATSVAARMGVVILAAWQVTMQLFSLFALTLDSVAVAGQALVGKQLGTPQPRAARGVGDRLMVLGIVLGVFLAVILIVPARPLAALFTEAGAARTASIGLIVWLGLTQPIAAAAFTLDGILIGAADTRFLAGSMVAASALFVGLLFISLEAGWGAAGLMASLTAWLVARSVMLAVRYRSEAWIT
jgi:MATE family multidrug resistance protein